MPTAAYQQPPSHHAGPSPSKIMPNTFSALNYTPIESLLLFHNLATYGASPNSFDSISEIMVESPIVQQLKTFDKRRYTPESLKELFVYHLRINDANITTLDNSSLQSLIKVVALKLYNEYKASIFSSIKMDESRVDALDREIEEIKRGEWDTRLLAEADRKMKGLSRSPVRSPLIPLQASGQTTPAPRTPAPLPISGYSTPTVPGLQKAPLLKPAPPSEAHLPTLLPASAPPSTPNPIAAHQSRFQVSSAPIPSPQLNVPPPPPHTPMAAASAPPQSTPTIRSWQNTTPSDPPRRPPGPLQLPITNPPRPNIPATQFSPVLPQPQSPPVTSGPYVPITPTSRTPSIPPLPAPFRINPPQTTQPHPSPLLQRTAMAEPIPSPALRQQQQSAAPAPSTPAPISIPPGPGPYRTPISGTSPSAMYHPAIPTLNPPYMRNPAVDRTPRRPSRVNTPTGPGFGSPAPGAPSTPVPSSLSASTPVSATPAPFATPRVPSPKPSRSDEPPKTPPRPSQEDISPISTPSNSPRLAPITLNTAVSATPAPLGAHAPPTTPFGGQQLRPEDLVKLQKDLVARLLASSKKARPYLQKSTAAVQSGGVQKRTGRVGSRGSSQTPAPVPNVRTRRSASAEAEAKPVEVVDVMEDIQESPAVPRVAPKPAGEDVEMADAEKKTEEEPAEEESGRSTRRATRARTASQTGVRRTGRRRTPRAGTPATDEETNATDTERQLSVAPTIPEDAVMADSARHPTPVPKTEPTDSNTGVVHEIPETPSPRESVQPKTEPSTVTRMDSVIAGQQPLIQATKKFSQLSAPLLANISAHKFASLFSNPVNERSAPGYHGLVYRPQDLKSIKSAIKSGSATLSTLTEASTPSSAPNSSSSYTFVPATTLNTPPKGIVNSSQLEKEIFRMFANACMYNKSSSEVAKETVEMAKEVERHVLEFRNAERLGEQGRRREAEKLKMSVGTSAERDRERSLTKDKADEESRREGTVESLVSGAGDETDTTAQTGRRGGTSKRGRKRVGR